MKGPEFEDCAALAKKAWENLSSKSEALGLPDLKIITYENFIEDARGRDLSREDRLKILAEAQKLFDGYYVHAFYKDMQGLAPAFAVIEEVRWRSLDADADAFHSHVMLAFAAQRDLHTLYGRPAPYKDAFAFLPFQIKHCKDKMGKTRFVVTKIMPGFEHEYFKVGVEMLRWGVPFAGGSKLVHFREALDDASYWAMGHNKAAYRANGLRAMTMRSLQFRVGPELPTAQFQFKVHGGKRIHSLMVPWGVGQGLSESKLFTEGKASSADEARQSGRGATAIWSTHKFAHERSGKVDKKMDSELKGTFEYQYAGGKARPGYLNPEYLTGTAGGGKKFGYIRIKNFALPEDDQDVLTGVPRIIEEFKRLLKIQMDQAPDGLILDLRGNPGGQVNAAESLLQMLTPRHIHPAKFHWPWNETIQKSLRRLKKLGAKKRRTEERGKKFSDTGDGVWALATGSGCSRKRRSATGISQQWAAADQRGSGE